MDFLKLYNPTAQEWQERLKKSPPFPPSPLPPMFQIQYTYHALVKRDIGIEHWRIVGKIVLFLSP